MAGKSEKKEKVEEIIKKFGEKHSKIEKIGFSSIPGDGKGYIFLAPQGYNRKLEDDVSRLSLRIMQEYKENAIMIVLPFSEYGLERVVYSKK